MKKQCKTLNELLNQINRGNRAVFLEVYSKNGTPAWSKGTIVTLNLGENRFCRISHRTYEKIKACLLVRPC